MPKNQFQRMIFALITVVITVHAYVFFSLYVIYGNTFLALSGESHVLAAIHKLGGVQVLGRPVPILGVVLIEFAFAYFTQLFLIQPLVRTVFKALFGRRAKKPETETAAC